MMNKSGFVYLLRCQCLNHFLPAFLLLTLAGSATAQDHVDLGNVRENHIMIPMRAGKRLSTYLYFPQGKPLTLEFADDAVKAVNTIHHNRQHASRILAPVAK